jgi:tRNA threonylcarbamoyladenosine biosynthesis protein TsaE
MIGFKSTSVDMTRLFAAKLAAILKAGDVIALDGDLGAGKTCFTGGLAEGMGSDDYVSSPTFTIVNEYESGRLPLFHFDTYRLQDEEDFLASGLDEYFYRGGVSVIEWSDIIKGLLPENTIRIRIKGTGDSRDFTIEADADTEQKIKKITEEILC